MQSKKQCDALVNEIYTDKEPVIGSPEFYQVLGIVKVKSYIMLLEVALVGNPQLLEENIRVKL